MQQSKVAAKPKPLSWTAPSHLTVFVRNLRLLQLDQPDNGPHITVAALSAAPQNQRQRIQAVEWALYQLFAIWDPVGTQNKLRPFFPPLEQLQSVNLRAALFRALSEVKKNGDLGRETILRKTMLDDCKGEKFEELLAAFSTQVLRKVVANTASSTLKPAMRLATANGVTLAEHQTLLPLILAHQVSLRSMGQRRAHVRQTHDKFSILLDQKHAELTSRSKQNSGANLKGSVDSDRVRRELRASWLGGEEWANALIHGGARSSTDGFLELPFSQAWARAKDSSVEGLSHGPAQDLLVDLEGRISDQRTRLRKWRDYRESLRENGDPGILKSGTPKQSSLVFKDHQSLHIASISKAVREPVNGFRLLEADQSLIRAVQDGIDKINGKSRHRGRITQQTFNPILPHVETKMRRKEQSPNIHPSIPACPAGDALSATATGPTQLVVDRSQSPIIQVSEDINHTSPDEPEVDSDIVPAELLPKPRRSNTSTLVERTRKSMSLIPPSDDKRRESIRPRKPRPSLPVNQFETPRKQSPQPHEITSRASTPRDQLFDEDVDYASVFKSRPRIVNSPTASPAVHVAPIDAGFNLDGVGDSDAGTDEDNSLKGSWNDYGPTTANLVDSPLANARTRTRP